MEPECIESNKLSLAWCRRWFLSSKKQRATRNWRRRGRSKKGRTYKDERKGQQKEREPKKLVGKTAEEERINLKKWKQRFGNPNRVTEKKDRVIVSFLQ